MATIARHPETGAHARVPGRLLLWVFLGLAVLGLGIALGARWLQQRLVSYVRAELLPEWSRQYDSDVTLGSLSVSVIPSVRGVGKDLVFRLRGPEHQNDPPLVHAAKVTVTAGILGLFTNPKRIHLIQVDGAELNVPPDHAKHRHPGPSSRNKWSPDRIRAENAVVSKLPKEPGGKPAVFRFRSVDVRGSGVSGDLRFRTELTVPKPPGVVRAEGRFGPWNQQQVSALKVSGTFELAGADLGVFHPIRGALNAKGRFDGILRRIEAQGSAEIPDFETTNAHHPIDLKANYEATVDGTNGDVVVNRLDAQFLHSKLSAHGEISGQDEKMVALEAGMQDGRLEDVLHFVLHDETPPFTGSAALHWSYHAPLSSHDLVDDLRIDGTTGLARLEPTRPGLRHKMDDLSAKAQGDPKAGPATNVVSDVRGHIDVRGGTAHLTGVSFREPGLFVTLDGTYGLRSEELNLHGTARMDATLSQSTTGVKSFFLKIVDPFFKRKNAGAAVPVFVTGTARHPKVSAGFRR